jgi:hypothetical protein
MTLPKDRYNNPLPNGKCLFKCLATFQNNYEIPERFMTKVNALCEQFASRIEKDDFSGNVSLLDLAIAEEVFDVNINVFSLVPKTEEKAQEAEHQVEAPAPVALPADLQIDANPEEHREDDSDTEGNLIIAEEEDDIYSSGSFADDMAVDAEGSDVEEEGVAQAVDQEVEEEQGDRVEVISQIIRRSPKSGKGRRTMNLDLCDNHFSLIKNINAYSKNWQCSVCGEFTSKKKYHMLRHEQTCDPDVEVRPRYTGGRMVPKLTPWEEAEHYGFDVPEDLKFRKLCAVWDSESFAQQIPDVEVGGHGTTIVENHSAIVVSMKSNVPDHNEAIVMIDEDRNEARFISKVYNRMEEIAAKGAELELERQKPLLDQIQSEIDKCKLVLGDRVHVKMKQKKRADNQTEGAEYGTNNAIYDREAYIEDPEDRPDTNLESHNRLLLEIYEKLHNRVTRAASQFPFYSYNGGLSVCLTVCMCVCLM